MQNYIDNNVFQNELSVQITKEMISSDSSLSSPNEQISKLSPNLDQDSSLENSYCLQASSTVNVCINTPIQSSRVPLNSTPCLNQLSQSLVTIVRRKPSVNFHSIEDIVYGSTNFNISNNDSGYQSLNSTNIKTINDSVDYENSEHIMDKENHLKSNSRNDKKFRTTFSDEQKKMLDYYFNQNPYPDPKETEEMSDQLQLPENVIKVWFQNKRSRDKQRKFSRENTLRRVELYQHQIQPNNQSPFIFNLQLITNQIKAAAALSALRNLNN